MNNKAQYELTITEKLEQLSVPDKIDAIWARIEATLDLDMPTDDGPKDPPAGSPAGPGFWFGAIFLIVLLSVIYFVNKRTDLPESSQNTSPETPAVIQAPGAKNDKPPPTAPGKPGSQNVPGIRIDSAFPPLGATNSELDPGAELPLPQADSAIVSPTIAAPVIPNPSQDTIPKKSRGVKGIKDGDYRIEPTKKDGP
ncbi:MAG: hypothetical protein EOO00_03355 [Chitinophagaceae bacterium]|nr:MAG: hypothetical protein EOO00_03355 [Chitinophagaceae bacterium]